VLGVCKKNALRNPTKRVRSPYSGISGSTSVAS